MKIENIKNDKKGMFLYKTNDFVTITMKLLFSLDNDKKSIITARILTKYLLRTNKKYKKYKTITNKLKEFYDMDIDINQFYIGKQNFLSFRVELLDPKVIEEDYLINAFKFAHEILLKPNFLNNHLDNDIFNNIKKDMINKERNLIFDSNKISYRLFYKNMIPDSNASRNIFTDIEEYEKIIESISEKDIIDSYNNIINNSFFKGYIFGNIDDKEFENIRKMFSFDEKIKELDYAENNKIKDEYKEIIDNDFKQSNLYVVYDIKDYSIDKSYLYKTILYLLNSFTGLCHKVLRTELGIVYTSHATILCRSGLLYIEADISEENKEKCLNGVDDIIRRLKDEKIVKDLLDIAKAKLNQEFYTNEELLSANIRELEDIAFNMDKPAEEINKLINNITPKDIINEIKKFEKKYIYFYRGLKKEKGGNKK